ncbi:hypothetical protein B6254_1180 [Weissella cibaria]|uniref:Uncharacterized protein n=2 Tax=Weissella cibaria TaxID=137591 RepID=A0A2S1KRF2_9LACO|nr:hypothetical protein B6254_1180 [Weissella cibaria]
MGGGFANVEAGAKKAAEANKLLANSAKTAAEAQKNASAAGTYTKQIGEINKLTEAYAKMESAAKKAEAAEKTRFSATQSNYQREREQSGTQNFSTPNYSETGKKLGSSFKEAVGMFSLGMLGANAVMGVFDGVKNMVSGGWETLNDRQHGQAMWATSISDAHGTSGSALTSQSSKANDQIMMTALKAGNNFDEANSFAKQIYSSDAGVYSGSLGKTNHMLKGIFNIQDANALNDREMEQFKTAVGNVGDTGKMSGTIAKSFNLLDGKITRSIRKEYEKETGHELGKNKQGGWDWASVSAEMAYRGIDNYGNSGGIAKASERYNSTLPGVIRSVKEGSKDYISQVMKTFGDEVAKGGGFSDVLGKISKAFTSKSLITNADQFASKLSGLANALGTGIKEIAPYAKTFGSGFMSGVKGTFNIIKMGVDQLKSFGSAIGKMIPEGSQKHIMDAVQAVGKFAGVAATVAASMKVLKGGASLLGDAGKGIKGILTGITRSKTTGDSVFSRATSQFSAAVSRFAGASGVKNAAGMAGDSLPGGFSKDAKGKYHRANGQYASDAEIAQLETRTGRRALASEAEASAGVFGRLFSKGQELKGVAGIAGETGRLAKNAGLLSRMGGSLATTVGKAGMAVSASKLGTVVSGIGKAGKFLGKGMPLLNGLFAGIDVMSTMATTQKGSLARHKGVGSAVGNGVGATIGGALGSALGPFGTVAGAMAGGWLGGKAGSWIGGMFGGTKDDKPKQTVAQRNAEAVNKAQTAAQATMAKQDFASNMAAYGYDKKNANELYSQINKGTNSKSKAKQIAAARMQEAIDAGDAAAISKWQSKLNKQNGILPGQENVDNRPKRIKARQVSLSDDKGAKKAEANAKAVSKANKSVKAPKGTDWNKYALNAQKASQKADKEFKKSAKSIGKTKIAPKSDKKGFDKVNRDAKSGMNKATKTVKSGAKKTQKAGKDAFKFKTSKSGFNKLNRDAKSGMNKVNRTVKSGSKKVQRSGKNMFKFKSSKSGFNKLNSQAKSGINKVARTVKSGVKKVQNAGKNVFKFKSSKSGFNQLNSTARSGMSRVARTVKSGATKIQNAAKNAFKFKAASSGFNQLNSQAKSGISRVTSTIKSGSSKWDSAIQSSLSKAASTMSSQFSKMASTASSKSSAIASSMAKIGTAASAAASKVNALQSAIDRLKSKTITITANVTGKGASKLATGTPGAKSAFASLIPRYAKGTTQGGHGGGLALVNDAKGANWREAFMLPNGLVGLFPNKRDLMMPLPTGTQVLNGDDTKKMFPRYASGTNGAKKAFGGGSMGNINITVNISGNASASDANAIGNTIGEKLMTILNPETI